MRVAAFALALILAAAPVCSMGAVSTSGGGAKTGVLIRGFAVHLAALGSSRESGTASFAPIGRATLVTIHVSGEPKDASQPAQIDYLDTTCASLRTGGRRQWSSATSSSVVDLTNVVGGDSTTIVKSSYRDLSYSKFAVVVGKSNSRPSVYVGCGAH